MTEQRIDGGGVRHRTLIDDPWAVRLYKAIDYDRFGKPSQSHPLRAARHPAARV